MAKLVMYCGIIVEVRNALRATINFTKTYTTVENNGYTNGSYAACETVKGRWILRCSEVAGS